MSVARCGRLIATCVTVMLLVPVPAAAATSKRRARVAVRYLVSQQTPEGALVGFSTIGSTADAVVAMVAARRAPNAIARALEFLVANAADVDVVGEKAKVVLARVAGGRSPRRFAGRDLVQEIRRARRANGRYGRDTPVLQHALAMLAVAGAGVDPGRRAARWLARAQCDDGGWQFDRPSSRSDGAHCNGGADDFFTSDTNTTSYAIQALEAHGLRERSVARAFRFLRRRRDPVKGGWGYGRTFSLTDANSTALAIQARSAAGRRIPARARRALKRLQPRLCGPSAGAFSVGWQADEDGGFSRKPLDLGATIGAIPGLLRRPLPVEAADVTRPAPVPGACP